MKRNSFGKGVLTALFVIMLIGVAFGCSDSSSQEEPVLQSIAIISLPAKTEYAKGEAFNLTGLIVTGTYSDRTTKAETVSLSNITGYNPDMAGEQTLTVAIDNKTVTFTVIVRTTGSVSINFEDPINGVPDATTLSKTGTDGAPASIALAITGTYADYAWRLNDAAASVSTTAEYTLNAADCRLGNNFHTVEVRTADGAPYLPLVNKERKDENTKQTFSGPVRGLVRNCVHGVRYRFPC